VSNTYQRRRNQGTEARKPTLRNPLKMLPKPSHTYFRRHTKHSFLSARKTHNPESHHNSEPLQRFKIEEISSEHTRTTVLNKCPRRTRRAIYWSHCSSRDTLQSRQTIPTSIQTCAEWASPNRSPQRKKMPSSNIQKEENIPIIILISPRKCRTNLFFTRNPGNRRAQEEPSPPNTRNSPECQ
jgi:hypothetical protein